MNPILQQIYATILPSAPYIIAAYALMWAALVVYVIYATVRMKKLESQMHVLQDLLEKRQGNHPSGTNASAPSKIEDASQRIKKK